MKFFKFYLIASSLLLSFNAKAQKSSAAGDDAYSKFSVSLGAGMANYYGDLIEKDISFSQIGGSLSAGVKYAFSSKFSGRIDLGYQQLRGADGKSGGAFSGRNLSFKSNVFDFAIAAEYTILDLNKFPVSPYISAGVGVLVFDPYTTDASTGKRQYLAVLNTEGQGLPGYGSKYNTSALEFPLGIGLKCAVNKEVELSLDFNYRLTRTDYLDDVSSNRYPSKALLDARNPVTSGYTFRGSGAYPTGSTPRGNPDNNDGFFTTQVKLAFKIQ